MRRATATTALDQALAERKRAAAAYSRAKRTELTELEAHPVYGQPLARFIATLHHFTRLEHADRMLAYVETECRKWLADAPLDIRRAALTACGDKEQQIRMKAGLPPFHDPMDGENMFLACKRMLGL